MNNSTLDVEWDQVGRGILVSMSQVYGIDDVTTSIMMMVAVGLASPLLLMTATAGATIGSFLGVALLPREDIAEVYAGVWGYNPLLAMAATSCVFFSFNANSLLLSSVTAAVTSVAQFALRVNMTLQNNIPVFTMPKTLVVLVFLLASNQSGSLHRVGEEASYPEKQAITFYRNRRDDEDEERGETDLDG